jgi:glycosyltransferase involved in cell wall biosynthesis
LFFYETQKQKVHAPISVIICAKNEADNLKNNLGKVLEQSHPNFEVIVVNDASTDNTDDVLGEFITQYKNLKTTSIPTPSAPKFSHGKKLAVTIGIKAAQHNWIVFIDADCWPESKDWLITLQTGLTKKEIVLGYGGFEHNSSLLNNFIRFETLNIAFMYLGFALLKRPYMGVGRNLAYKKDLFFKNKGFANNYGILSGDDDLFINETATATNTSIVIDKDSFTRSKAKTKWKDYFYQKIRHLTTANSYKPKHSFMIGLEPISRAWFYFLFIFLLANRLFLLATIIVFIIRLLIQFSIYLSARQKFGEKNLWLSFIIFDVFSLFFNFAAYLTLSFRRNKIKWK